MVKTLTAGPDLSARFYDADFAVLSRRDGRRAIVTRDRARVLRHLAERLGLDGVAALRGLRVDEAPEALAVRVVSEAFDDLDRAAVPTPAVALLRRAPEFYEHAQRRRIPLLAMIELTYRCNLRCRHCFILDRIRARPAAHAGTRDVEGLLHALRDAGCLDVTLTGGETTLHADYRALVSLAKSLHLETTLKTNATTFDAARAAEYAADAAHETQASLYGATAEVHDAFTATPGSFDRTLRGLRHLARAGVRCLVSCIVWHGDARQLEAVEALVHAAGHEVAFSDVIYGRLGGDRAPLELRLRPQQRAELIERGRLQPFSPEPCIAGTIKLKVEPHGGLSICELLPGEGNVFETPFERLWRDPRLVGRSDEIIRLSTSEHHEGRPVRSCPAMNLLDTGRLTGLTTIG